MRPIQPVEEEAWDGTLDPPTEADLAHALSQSLSGAVATEADIDRLWDWVRADEDKGKRFLGVAPATSQAMRQQLLAAFPGHLYALFDEGLDGKTEHVGFAAFGPFTSTAAFTHLYLSQVARGKAPALIPQMVSLAQEIHPNMTLAVQTEDVALARLCRGAGFTLGYFLSLKPGEAEPALTDEPVVGEAEEVVPVPDEPDPTDESDE